MKRLSKIVCIVLGLLLVIPAFNISIVSSAGAASLDKNAVFIDGYPDGTFLPDKTMTRAEAIKVTAVAAGYISDFDGSSVKTDFADLNENEWYAPYVKYLEKYDMLNFYGRTLSAGSGITRGEFVKLITNFVPAAEGNKTFPDVSSSHPYYKAIIKAANAGIVEGNPDGTFNPNGTLTRAQIVTIIDRLLERHIITGNTAKVTKFSDIKYHWAESYVIAASCNSTYEGKIVWYTGSLYSENSPVDKTTLDYSTTKAILNGIDASDADAVRKSLDAYTEKRIEEIRATPNTVTAAPEGATTYYVSADGNDANDGKTPETAWKTPDKVSSMRNSFNQGDVVLFRRGDEFRGKFVIANYVTYSAYGEGKKPVINGSLKNYAGGDLWKPAGKRNVYELSETFSEDVGLMIFDGTTEGVKKAKGINGTMLFFDLEFYHNPETGKLTLYSIKDPNTRFNSIEIGTYEPIISSSGAAKSLTVDNLKLIYGGGYASWFPHGSSNVTFTNCEIGWCGGSLMKGRENDPVRLGNAIELYGTSNGFTVDNCYIYHMYDAGVSHQYFGETNSVKRDMKKIKYTNNVITHCTYAVEYINDHDESVMQDVEISGNLLLATGSGLGKQRPERNGSLTAGIKGWGGTNLSKNFLIYDNVIEATDEEAALIHMAVTDASDMPEVTGNIFMSKTGNRFGLYGEGDLDRDRDMITYNDKITDTTIALDDNTFVFLR